MYTPRALFSRLFLKICLFVLSLYTVGRLVTLPCEICVQSPVICVNSHYRIRRQSMVCLHTKSESDNALMRCGHLTFFKMATGRHLGFDPTENGAVRSAISENPTLEQTWRGSDDTLQHYGHLKFSKVCEWALRSVVGRWSSVGWSLKVKR